MGRITVDGTQCQFSYKESDIEKVLTQHYKYLI